MSEANTFCRKCGSVATKIVEGSWGPHTRKIVCGEPFCGAFVGWAPRGNGASWKDRALFYIRKMAKCGDVDAMELVDKDGRPT